MASCDITPVLLLLLLLGISSCTIAQDKKFESRLPCDGTRPSDVVIVIDSSPTLTPERWNDSLAFAQGLVGELDISADTTHVSVMTYNREVIVHYEFNDVQDASQIIANISQIPQSTSPGSNLPLAMAKISFELLTPDGGNRANFPDLVVLVTGTQPQGILKAKDMCEVLKKDGVRFFVVAHGKATTDYGLRQLATADAEASQRHLHEVMNGQRAQDLVADVKHYMCRDAQLCTETADILFVIDSSGSMNNPTWQQLLNFTRNVVRTLPIGRYNVRAAVITYSNYAYVNLTFDAYMDAEGVASLVGKLVPHDKNTNTTGALRLARTQIFTGLRGDRDDVRNVICLVTDGHATWEKEGLAEEAARVHSEGIQVYVIGFGDNTDSDELRMVASKPHQSHLFEIEEGSVGMGQSIVMRWTECAKLHRDWDSQPGLDITDLGFCDLPLDLALVVDGSGSVGRTKFFQYLDYIRELLPRLNMEDTNTHVALVTYSSQVDLRFGLNNFTRIEDIMLEIDRSQFDHGTTDTATALRTVKDQVFVTEHGDRPQAPNVVLLLSDGESDDEALTLKCARELRDAGVVIVTVAFGNRKWLKVNALQGLANEPREWNARISPGFQEALEQQAHVVDSLCNRMDECSVAPCGDQGECEDGIRDYTCSCYQGFAGRNCDQVCRQNLDIIFALDSSGSVGDRNFQLMIDFIKSIAERLPFTDASPEQGTRIGIVTFGSEAQIHLNLSDYSDLTGLKNALHFYYDTGSTNAADAIAKITQMFAQEETSRESVPNVAVMILDGKSDDVVATWEESVRSRDAGVHWMVVGVGHMYRYYELQGIASPPVDSSIIRVDTFEQLEGVTDDMFDILCNVEDECKSAPCQHGGTCVDSLKSYVCLCMPGHHGKQCEYSTPVGRDIVFLVDTSFEMRRYNLPILVEFINGIIAQIKLGDDESSSQVGIVVFGDKAEVMVPLNKYPLASDLMHVTERLKYIGGLPDIAKALRFVDEQVWTSEGGDREAMANYVVLVAYGNTEDHVAAIEAGITSRLAGNTLIVAAVADMLKHKLLYQSIASHDDMAMVLGNPKEFRNSFQGAADLLLDDTNFCNGISCENGGTCIPRPHGFRCHCPEQVSGRYCERRCARRSDVAIVLDQSGSMQDEYHIALAAAKELTLGLNLDPNHSRLAYITYAETVRLHFTFGDYASGTEAIEAVTLDNVGGDTNVEATLDVLRGEFAQRGRSDVRQVVVWLSDGKLAQGVGDTMNSAFSFRFDTDLEVFAVGIGAKINRVHLNGLSSSPAAVYRLDIPTEDTVNEVVSNLLNAICI